MKPKVYVETTVVSYLTARPSRDIVTLAHQHITHEWWRSAASRFNLVTSELVRVEASAGDPAAARSRLDALAQVAIIEATAEAAALAEELLDLGALPRQASQDAAHVAIAVSNSIDYLVTWNLRHIANVIARTAIERACRRAGYRPPAICTPEELLEIVE
ncbi:MAG: type II toxin-antitoxin system VapC family toxin [Chloroflexi bacterium]|nr:type II toxin-antitoxin system VapC family toxin [Chloroflexota bacterium]